MEFSPLTWLTGFVTTLILPLIILLAAHGILRIPLRDSQGTAIFLFFGWATSSQAILTLYRLRAVASWKVAASMLFSLFLVVVTYLLAAESFTRYLFAAPGEVASHFQAGALPGALFDLLVAVFALLIVLGWFLIYAKSHGPTVRTPEWLNRLQARVYLLLLNRLYLDALSMRLQRRFTRAMHRLNASRRFPYAAGLVGGAAALFFAARLPPLTPGEIGLFFFVVLLLPLFPLHGLYVAALTRLPGYQAAIFAVLLPAAGLFGFAHLPELPAEVVAAVRALALFGALYGSLKALVQVRVPQLLAYGGVALLSAFWWRFAVMPTATVQLIAYVAVVALLTAALLLAWQRVEKYYGKLTLDHMHGLARPLPRFGVVVSLLVMAAVGLPPFGLFSTSAAMLLKPASAISWELMIILLSWFLSSWYLFRMMQRLLFGPHRNDIPYQDLRGSELAAFALLLAILAVLGTVPLGRFESDPFIKSHRLALEKTLWHN
jgi:NADH:ubiquinone oxidoreductase subunit 5 (subunit L)/multisubunit Na+/H+ antiporter MnhA subunit